MSNERVICAAIWVDDGRDDHDRASRTYPTTGLVFAGWRHADCYTTLNAWAERLTPEERKTIGEAQFHGLNEGFLTSTGRFVGRTEGYQVALRAQQVAPGGTRTSLSSEDLY